MSIQVTTAMVQGYREAVEFLTQQKGSILRSCVREEPIHSKRDFFDQIGVAEAQWKTSRHQPTPRMDTPHSRRSVTTRTAQYSDLIDKDDEIRTIAKLDGKYATAAMWALGRKMDDVIIEAVTAAAYTGETGATQTSYDSNMTVDVQVVSPGGSASDWGLNVQKLIAAKMKLDQGDNDPDEERYIAVNARQIASLLSTTKATSADYNTVKALVEGKIDTFMGFRFKMTNRLLLDGNNDDIVPFWCKSGLLLAVGADLQVDIGPRRDMSMATQVYAALDVGATRMQESKVGYIECDVATGPGTA